MTESCHLKISMRYENKGNKYKGSIHSVMNFLHLIFFGQKNLNERKLLLVSELHVWFTYRIIFIK